MVKSETVLVKSGRDNVIRGCAKKTKMRTDKDEIG